MHDARDDPDEHSPIVGLPREILSLIIERLGLQCAASARAVCSSWRQAADAVQWRWLELTTRRAARAEQLAKTLVPAAAGAAAAADQAAAAGEARGRGPGDFDDAEDPELSWGAALKLVAASAAASGAGGLGGMELFCQRSSSCCAGDLLRALTPPAPPAPPGGCAQGALRYLRLTGSDRSSYSLSGESPECAGLPDGLEDLLRPFPRLEVLDLPSCCTADAVAVSALARSLPRLRELQLGFAPGLECAAGLAPLAALEILDLKGRPGDVPDLAPVLEGLAAGPAARSLQRIQGDGELTEFGLRALPRLTALRCLQGQYAVRSLAAPPPPPPPPPPPRPRPRPRRARPVFVPAPRPALRLFVPAPAPASAPAELESDLRPNSNLISAPRCFSAGGRLRPRGGPRRPRLLHLLLFGPRGEEAVPLLAELLAGFRAALERTPLLELGLNIPLPPSSESLAALSSLVRAAGPGRLELSVDLNFRDGGAGLPSDPAAAAALCEALVAAPPRSVDFTVNADPDAVAAGRLAALAALAGCYPLTQFEVRLRLGSPKSLPRPARRPPSRAASPPLRPPEGVECPELDVR
eukprot:tig00000900_g5353.t1